MSASSAGNPAAKAASTRFDEIGRACALRLARNKRVRRTLPGGGRLRIDRQLPFLCVYRYPADGDDAGTRDLVTSEAAYLVAPGDEEFQRDVAALCGQVQATLKEHFGKLLFLEVWSAPKRPDESRPPLQPAFTIVADADEPRGRRLDATIESLTAALSEIVVAGQAAKVDVDRRERVAPPEMPPLRAPGDGRGQQHGYLLGLEIRPVYRDGDTGAPFPVVLKILRSQLAKAFRKGVATFAGFERGQKEVHYQSLGPTSMVKAARLVDQQLCEVSESFDFLLQATPTNADDAWGRFQQSDYQKPPVLAYRPLPYDPGLLKRQLFAVEIERIEDATVSHLCWEKQVELDRQISALRDLNTPQFLSASCQLYGHPDDALVELAEKILAAELPTQPAPSHGERLAATEVAARAREEIDYYRQRLAEFNATVEMCDHIAAGLMVSRGKLMIAHTLGVAASRVAPLLHHEVGTHLLTYYNGRVQPLRQLYAGLAGYEELQEGLAVLAEHLVGGLTPHRLRALAARVIAVRMMYDQLPFVETFDRLHHAAGLGARTAFVTVLRAYRGGGLTKDVIYLRGLCALLAYLGAGHDVEPLYVGKIALDHLPLVQEMRRRGVLKPPAVLPRFWDDDAARSRLDACRGMDVLQLFEAVV